jgi:hypothetical protein
MQIAVLEASLQAMCFLYPEEAKRTATFGKKRFRRKRNRALEFTLNELINLAEEAGWFPQKQVLWAGKRASLCGFTHEIRKLRNFVHPAVWAQERPPNTKFSKGVFGVVYKVFDVANSWLLHRIEKSLAKRMKREGLL